MQIETIMKLHHTPVRTVIIAQERQMQIAGGSKMVTREQKQTVWARWIKKLAETLKPHLAEIKHQGESKLQHPEPLDHRKLLYAMLHWEIRRAATALLRGRHSADQTGEHQASCGILPATPRINQHSPLGRLTSFPGKKQNNTEQ
jgi:hypothetical protein